MIRTGVLARLRPELERFLTRQVLGLEPDPDHWPPPHDLDSLKIPCGIDRTDQFGSAWTLDSEFAVSPIKVRTPVGAHAYRLTHNREYDCGWRLVDVAARFLSACTGDRIDLVTIIPPPPIYMQVEALTWTTSRLGEVLSAEYAPSFIKTAAPLAIHPDTVPRPNIPFAEMFTLNPKSGNLVHAKHVLLADWRWRTGRSITTVARLLHQYGAQVTRFSFLP